MLQNQHKCIYEHIQNKPKGSVFVLSDFENIADIKTVAKIFERLEKKNVVSRIRRGIYWKPDNNLDGPNISDLISALARIKSWDIVPLGETALHEAGIVTSEPLIWTYSSNGCNRTYDFNGRIIEFKHNNKKDNSLSKETKFTVELIKACMKMNYQSAKNYLTKIFSTKQIKKILSETKFLTNKFKNYINNIFIDYKSVTTKEV